MHESTHHARAQLGIPCDSRTRPARVRVPFSLMQLVGLLPSFKRENVYLQHAGHPIPTDLEAAKALSSRPAALDLFTGFRIGVSLHVDENEFRCLVSLGL